MGNRRQAFSAAYVREILKNPAYCGKIAYSNRPTEKVRNKPNEYRIAWNQDYLLCDGIHEALVSVQDWEDAQVRLRSQGERYKRYEHHDNERAYLLTGLLKCPECGAGMYVSKSVKKRKDGSYYGEKSSTTMAASIAVRIAGINAPTKRKFLSRWWIRLLSKIVLHLLSKNAWFTKLMAEKINTEIDTSALEQEIAHLEKQLRQQYSVKEKLIEEIDQLDPDDRHYRHRKSDLDERLFRMYDKIDESEICLSKPKQEAIHWSR